MNNSVPDIEETSIGAFALLVTPNGDLILQQRDSNPNIVNPGLISMFGGTINRDESLEDGLVRELDEELELKLHNPKALVKLGTYHKTKELDGMDYEVNVFLVKGVDSGGLKIHEGKGFVVDKAEGLIENSKLTRMTRLAVGDYLNQEN